MILYYLFFGLVLILTVASYFWFDHSLMWMLSIDKPFFLNLEVIRNIRFEHRIEFANGFIALIILLTLIQIILLLCKNKKPINKILKIIFLVSVAGSIAYPFLSKDIFSYMFGAKIWWHYRQNPYKIAPINFQSIDMQLSFTHWLYETYVYGPVYLFISSIPGIIFGSGRFILNFLGIKIINCISFLLSGWLIFKINKDKRVLNYWFLNPLLIVEYLVNSHNDLIMATLFFASIYFWKKRKGIESVSLFLASVLTKFISGIFLPVYFIKEKYWEHFFRLTILAIIIGFIIRGGQLWYFTWIFMAVPMAKLKNASLVLIYLFSLQLIIIKYYGFALADNWSRAGWLDQTLWLLKLFPLTMILIEYGDKIHSFGKFLKKKMSIMAKSP